MKIHELVCILLVASSAFSLPISSPQATDVRLASGIDVTPDSSSVGGSGVAIARGKRGYVPAAAIAYSPGLSLAGVPIVATPIVTSYSYYGHYGKPAVVPPPIIPPLYSPLHYLG